MVRHVPPYEPPSKLAAWSRGLALFALANALIGFVLARGYGETLAGLSALAASLLFAALAIVLALAALAGIWRSGHPGARKAFAGLAIGALLIAYPAFVAVQARHLPAIADVSTDTVDPPKFEELAKGRRAGANPAAYPGEAAARRQRAAYPDVVPLLVAASPAEAHTGVVEVIGRMRWTVAQARAPEPRQRRDGIVEAVALTRLMGLRQDVVVRVRASGRGSIIDIRSASRYGPHDFGSNAQRIRDLRSEIETELTPQAAAQ